MPRPKQRKAADDRKAEKQAKREQLEAEQNAKAAAEKRARHRKSEMQWDSLNAVAGPSKAVVVDPNALPEPDPDTKAYFHQVAAKIQELEDLGQGAGYRGEGEGEGDEEEEDDRPLLLRSALESLSGQEIQLAGDNETSVVLERLLYSMDDAARRVLADRFTGQFERLAKHRTASHVLQTLVTLAGETVDRETKGNVAETPSIDDSVLPTMTSLMLTLLSELLPTLPTLLYDPFGSHLLRSLLLLFSGQSTNTLPLTRSKKSQSFRTKQGPIKSFLLPSDEAYVAPEKLSIPPSFSEALDSIWHALNDLDPPTSSQPPGEGIRRAAMDEIAGPAVRTMLEIEAAQPGGWLKGGWADRVLVGLVDEASNPESELKSEERTKLRDEFLAGMVRHKSGSTTFETLLSRANSDLFAALWESVFVGQLHRLAGNQVANFVVAVGISRLEEAQFRVTVKEMDKIGTERRAEWIDNTRTGVMQNLLDRAAKLKVCEAEMAHIMLDTFGLKEAADQKLVIPCVLSLRRLEYFKKIPSGQTVPSSMQGSLLLQAWLRLAGPHQQPVVKSLLSMDIAALTPLTRDSTSSHVIDAFLSSPSTTPRDRRMFLLSLIGHFPALCDDRIGSRVVEKCWETADVYLKDKIAASVVDDLPLLQKSAWSHFWARKLELPLWQRRREDWKLKMSAKKFGEVPKPAVQVVLVEEEKKRERQLDEVDEIFSRAAKKSRV